jgi:hypothetical protein
MHVTPHVMTSVITLIKNLNQELNLVSDHLIGKKTKFKEIQIKS